MNSIIIKNTREIIDERGLKCGAVAAKAGYSEKVFSNILNGRKTITDEVVVSLCRALEVTPNELFGITRQKAG